MIKPLKMEGLKKSDRVYKFAGYFVKIRLLKNEISGANKKFGPLALSFTITASLCDKNGKAMDDGEGKFAILPYTLTIPLIEAGPTQEAIKKGLEEAIQPLIRKTIRWAKSRKAAEKVLADWEETKP